MAGMSADCDLSCPGPQFSPCFQMKTSISPMVASHFGWRWDAGGLPVRASSQVAEGRSPGGEISVWYGWLTARRALIEKSMSICESSSPGWLPACLKSPNEAWSRYLIPQSLCQSDFVAEVIPLVSSPPPCWGSNAFASPFQCVVKSMRSFCGTTDILHQHSTDMSCWEHQSKHTTSWKEHCVYCGAIYHHQHFIICRKGENICKEHGVMTSNFEKEHF